MRKKRERRRFGSIFRRPGRPGWYIKYPHPDFEDRKSEYAGSSEAEAKRTLKAREREFMLGGLSRRGGTFLKDYYEEFLAIVEWGERTKEGATGRLKTAATYFARQGMETINRAACRRFIHSLRKKGLSVSTRRKYRSELSTLWILAEDDEITDHNPWRGLKIGKIEVKPRPRIEPEGLKKIYEASEDDRDVITILGETGARLGEAADLEWRYVYGDVVTLHHTKTGRPRDVPLTPLAIKTLARLRRIRFPRPKKGPHFVFPEIHENRYNLSRRFRRRMIRHGMTGVTVHVLRHAFASNLRMRGVDILDTQELLGHESIATTARYTSHAREGALKDAIRILAESRGQQDPRMEPKR